MIRQRVKDAMGVRNLDTIIFFSFFFSYKGDFLFSFYIIFFLLFILKIFSLYITSTNDISLNLKDFIYELFSENTTIYLLKLAYIGKNSY